MRPLSFLSMLVVGLLLLGAQPTRATTYAVGTCRPSLSSFSTIKAAVGSVPSGSTVLVCPNTYPEQFTISTPLTLQGVSSGNSARAVITVPSGGLAVSLTSIFGETVAAQVLVTSGPVNIIDITVDGTGNSNGAVLAGIFYESGSSGAVNEVTIRNGILQDEGFGIWVENGNTTNESVTIENCSVHDVTSGIYVASNQTPPTLTATVKGNNVANASYYGIVAYDVGGTITGNVIVASSGGIVVEAPASVLSNTITDTKFGMTFLDGAAIVKSNVVSNSSVGITLDGVGATIEGNKITKASGMGIDFLCIAGNTISGNTISDTPIGVGDVPSSLTVSNTYYNVDTIRSGACTSAVTPTGAKQVPLALRPGPN
jgi:parallel beta-helix repeat protein